MVDQVRQSIAEDIMTGRLAAEEKLVIGRLAEEFGVSITPVREALRQLQQEGLVKEVAYSGMQVSPLSVSEAQQLFAVRGVLEGYATRLAAEAAKTAPGEALAGVEESLRQLDAAAGTEDVEAFRQENAVFHRHVVRLGAGPFLLAEIDRLNRQTGRYGAVGVTLDVDYLEAAQREHHELVQHLREGRAAEAEALQRRHALTFVKHLSTQLEPDR